MKPANQELSKPTAGRQLRLTLHVVATAVVLVAGTAAAPVSAQDSPTGGAIGCKSEGNCQGTMYKDPKNLDRWWYRRCSGCHAATVAEPTEAIKEPAADLRTVFADPARFWRLHGQAQADPVLKRLLPKTQLKPVRTIPADYQALMRSR
jgi:hypothetical protein